jgi:hypothetical protein
MKTANEEVAKDATLLDFTQILELAKAIPQYGSTSKQPWNMPIDEYNRRPEKHRSKPFLSLDTEQK